MRSQYKQLGRWSILLFLLTVVVSILYASVSLSPASGQAASVDSELLAKQLEFMLKMNTAFLGFLGTVGVLLTWFFKNNLDDAKEVAADIVERELQGEVSRLVGIELELWKKTILPERAVRDCTITYFLPDSKEKAKDIKEIELLKIRGFRQPVQFCTTQAKLESLQGDVTILDFQNMKLPDDRFFGDLTDEETIQRSKPLIETLLNDKLPEVCVLVAYFNGKLARINPERSTQYLLIANNPVTLLGHVANGAYVSRGAQAEDI